MSISAAGVGGLNKKRWRQFDWRMTGKALSDTGKFSTPQYSQGCSRYRITLGRKKVGDL